MNTRQQQQQDVARSGRGRLAGYCFNGANAGSISTGRSTSFNAAGIGKFADRYEECLRGKRARAYRPTAPSGARIGYLNRINARPAAPYSDAGAFAGLRVGLFGVLFSRFVHGLFFAPNPYVKASQS